MRRYVFCCCNATTGEDQEELRGLNGTSVTNKSTSSVGGRINSNGRGSKVPDQFVTNSGAADESLGSQNQLLLSSKVSDPVISNSHIEEVTNSDTSSVYTVKDQKPRPQVDWVIGLDFGTTYSGFAYARVSDDPQINVYYDWPRKQNEKPYCKTLTGLYYRREEEENSDNFECLSWGYSARSDYMDHRDNRRHVDPSRGIYLTKFKLLLMRDWNDPALTASIPPPLTAMSIITDYLRLIGEHALTVVGNHHIGPKNSFSRDSVEWVVTVPSIWDENAKQQMKACMVNAGLVSAEAGGIDAVKVVLEPEAASFHCHEILHQKRKDVSLETLDKILVADVGGGTVDIVVQEMIGSTQNYRVQELTESSGGLCGGTFVDVSFMKFLSKKIPCLDEFLRLDYPPYKTRLLKDWEEIKCAFGHEIMSDTDTKDIILHNKLAMKWEAYETARGITIEDSSVVELTQQDLKSIFDPVVDGILDLIAAQLTLAPDIKVMFVVGGFAGSPYLMQRIRARFAGEVAHIVSPPEPGSAIVQGAVSLALHPDAVVSRIAKKTYGTTVVLPFEQELDPVQLLEVSNGAQFCRSRFDVFVRKGARVEVNTSVTKNYVPHRDDQKHILFDLWSSTEQEPRYTEGKSVTKEGDFSISLPENYSQLGEFPRFDLSMFFGRSSIELRAVGKSCEGRKARSLVLPVKYCS